MNYLMGLINGLCIMYITDRDFALLNLHNL